MRIKTILAAMTVLLVFSHAGADELYQWVDENGVTTLKDTPPPASKKPRKVKVYNDSDFDPAPPQQTRPAYSEKSTVKPQAEKPKKEQEPFNGTVELYVTSWCGYCKKARKYMESNGIPYVAYDIEKDSAAEQRHKELGGRGVPLIVIGSKKISGFSPELIQAYLKNSR